MLFDQKMPSPIFKTIIKKTLIPKSIPEIPQSTINTENSNLENSIVTNADDDEVSSISMLNHDTVNSFFFFYIFERFDFFFVCLLNCIKKFTVFS